MLTDELLEDLRPALVAALVEAGTLADPKLGSLLLGLQSQVPSDRSIQDAECTGRPA